MSCYLDIYLKDLRTNTYSLLFTFCGYKRDAFDSVIGGNFKTITINDKAVDVALQVSRDKIKDIVDYANSVILKEQEGIEESKRIIKTITAMNNSLEDKLKAIQEETDLIEERKAEIKQYEDVKHFYYHLLMIEDCENRIFAGLECFAPDGSDAFVEN